MEPQYKLQIISDSGCDLTQEMVSDESVHYSVVPLTIHIGEEVITDGPDIDIKKLLETVKRTKGPASTACPSPEAYAQEFRRAETTFAVTISAELSGSYQSAMIARDMVLSESPEKKIYVFNSLSVCAGQSLLVLKIKELAKSAQEGFETVVAKAEEFCKSVSLYFLIESYETLIKAGRMSRIAGLVASALSIRAICGDNGEGKIRVYEKIRGAKNALTRMVEMIGKRAPTKGRKLMISHCESEEDANTVKALAEKLYDFGEILICPMRGMASFYAGEKGIIVAW